MKILIVDDEPEHAHWLRVLLEGDGQTVVQARHGDEALVPAREQPPDLIISGLQTPVMEGDALLRNWRTDAQLKSIPFVGCAHASTDPMAEQLALDLGADAFIAPPSPPQALWTRLNQVLTATAQRPECLARHGAMR
jgi:CheY-like chemotaxis protein